jgi:serine/threonine-protein kinase RsbW
MADLIRFSVPGKPEYVGVVRLAISSAANTAGFDVEDIEDIKVAVSEVCTHVFCSDNDVAPYEVSCELGDKGIMISIDDIVDDYESEISMMKECMCLPHCRNMMTDIFDPSTSIFMLRTLMDEVNIFSNQNERRLIRMLKYFG